MLNGLLLLASLWSGFLNPPDAAKAGLFADYARSLSIDFTGYAGETALEAMKKLGFGGVLMFDSRGYWDDDDHVRNPKAEIDFMGPEWFGFVEFSIRECARLGLGFTMNASASGRGSGQTFSSPSTNST